MPRDARAHVGCSVVLSTLFAAAIFAALLALGYLVVAPPPQALPLGSPHASGLELATYLVGFAFALPLGLWIGRRSADGVAAGANSAYLAVLTACLVAAFAASLIGARLTAGAGVVMTLVFSVLWGAGAIVALRRARDEGVWVGLARLDAHRRAVWAFAGALTVASLLVFQPPRLLITVPTAVAMLLAAAALIAFHGAQRWKPSARGRVAGRLFDALAIALLLLAVPDFAFLAAPGVSAGGMPTLNIYATVASFHHDLFLGPVNQLLAGDGIPIATASQYGVAPMYLIAGWFQLAPIGYGTFGLLDGVLTALCFVAAYSILRLLHTPRLLAAAAMFVGVIALVYHRGFPVGVLPQLGPLRFGLPMLLLVAVAVEGRWPSRAGAARAARMGVIGLASIWSVEAFAYCLTTAAALWCFQAWADESKGIRWLGREALTALAACVATHVGFALVLLAAFGHLPDWGLYLALVREFAVGPSSHVTFDGPAWTPAIAMGVAYAASVCALVHLGRSHRELVVAERGSLAAIAAATGYGIITLYYYVDRSLLSVLPYLALPLLIAATLWLALLLRAPGVSAWARTGSLAFALAIGTMLLGAGWSSADQFGDSALGHLVPGGPSFGSAISSLWHPAPLHPLAPRADALYHRYMPGQERVFALLPTDLQTESLIRAGLANAFPFSDPWEEALLGPAKLPGVEDAVAQMHPNDRVLVWRQAFSVPRAAPATTVANRMDTPAKTNAGVNQLLPLQQATLELLRERFHLVPISRRDSRMVVVRLEPKAPS